MGRDRNVPPYFQNFISVEHINAQTEAWKTFIMGQLYTYLIIEHQDRKCHWSPEHSPDEMCTGGTVLCGTGGIGQRGRMAMRTVVPETVLRTALCGTVE